MVRTRRAIAASINRRGVGRGNKVTRGKEGRGGGTTEETDTGARQEDRAVQR